MKSGSRQLSRAAALAAVSMTLASLFSCASAPPSSPAPDWKITKIDSLQALSKDKPAEAIDQALYLLARPEGGSEVDRKSLEMIVASASERLASPLLAQGDDLEAAIVAAESLKALSYSPEAMALLPPAVADLARTADVAERRALLAKAEEAWKHSNRSLADALLSRAIPAEPAGAASLRDLFEPWLARMTDSSQASLATRLAAALGQVPAQSAESGGARLDPAVVAAIEPAVITVRVDRGIKIEQGLGSPDRVLGSGFFIDPNGYLITNYHVIQSEVDPSYEGYSRVTVKPAGDPDTRYPAKVVGWDPLLDLALLKAEMTPPRVFVLAPSPAPPQGAAIYALGSPLGLESTITAGIVSATGRKVLQWGDVIQIDAPLNPGNSGGPLLDAAGNVRGVVFASISGYQGLNFAITATWLLDALPSLYRGGEVAHPWLGYILDDAPKGGTGLSLRYRSPAVPPSVHEGETILAANGHSLERVADLQALLLNLKPGELVSLRVRDQAGRERTVLRALGSRPEHPLDEAIAKDTRDRIFPALLGMDVARIPGGIFGEESYSITKVRAGSIADEAGLSEGDPFTLYGLALHEHDRAAILQIHVKKRKAGFLESIIQIPVPLDIPDFV